MKNTLDRFLFGSGRQPHRRPQREEPAPPPLITADDLADLPPAEPAEREEDAA